MTDTTPIEAFHGDYRFLSNFWPSHVMLDGEAYPTVEHAYQAAKTNVLAERQAIRNLATPGQAKRMGRRITLRGDWEQVKLRIMEQLVRSKFSHPTLRKRLAATAGRELIEGNTWNDTFWGVCNGNGKNHLGRILMKVRAEILG